MVANLFDLCRNLNDFKLSESRKVRMIEICAFYSAASVAVRKLLRLEV